MRIQYKLLILMAVTSSLIILAYYIFFNHIILNFMVKQEFKHAEETIKHCRNIIQHEIDGMKNVAVSQGFCEKDDAYFLKTFGPAATEDTTLYNTDMIDFIAVYDAAGKLVAHRSFAVKNQFRRKFETRIIHTLPDPDALNSLLETEQSLSGVYLPENLPSLVVIFKRGKPGEKSIGTVVLARMLDTALVEEMSKLSGYEMEIHPKSVSSIDADHILERSGVRLTGWRKQEYSNAFTAHVDLPSVMPDAPAHLKVRVPWHGPSMADDSPKKGFSFELIALLAFFGLITVVMQLWVIRPLNVLTKKVEAIDPNSIESVDLAIRRQDEVGILAKSFMRILNQYRSRNRHMQLLSELDNLLAACDSMHEAGTVINRIISTLFPDDHGAISVINNSGNLLEVIGQWGEDWPGDRAFGPTECWALRRGQLHLMKKHKPTPVCSHMREPESGHALCVPMLAQGQTLGVFHLVSAADELDSEKQRLLSLVAEHASLALANLRLREQLRHQAIRDPLTGLYNRRHLEDSLEREISRARRQNNTFSLFMMDLDFFKRFNDTFGHEAGDYVLKQLGLILTHFVRKEDVACRYGGEEFTLILPGADIENAMSRAEELCDRVRKQELHFNNDPLGVVTLSVGVAEFPTHSDTIEGIIGAADTALYHAKANGRDRAERAG